MGTNDKNLKIIKSLFKGDGGAESKLQNDAILALLIRQDCIVNTMTATQKTKYDAAIEPYLKFTDSVKNNSLENYKLKCSILGVSSIFDVEENVQDEEEITNDNGNISTL